MDSAKIVSVFDGMGCGMLAMMEAGVKVGRYVAFEIDKYAVQTSSHNFPEIEHRGDVFQADFTEFEGFDWLVGGSPCTYWSIAQKNNRETEASGLGWELFCQYVRALREVKPRFFIYENNKSMAKAIRQSITEAFGFEPICINSALVSAQTRQRLYWVGKRNEDGTYSKVNVEQPEDRGILLKDVLDGVAIRDKGNCLCGNRGGKSLYHDLTESRHNYAAEPINITEAGKAQCLRATCYKDGIRNMVGNDIDRKTCVAEPVNITETGKAQVLKANYHKVSTANFFNGDGGMQYAATGVAEPIKPLSEKEMEYMVRSTNGKYSDRWAYLQKPGERDKALCIKANISKGVPYNICAEEVPCCAVAIEWDEDGRPIKAVSGADGKEHPVYEVKDGFITIKGKKHAIKLADGYYIIRKLTVSECKRLQTVPEWFEFPVSDTQAYKMLGNGWTVSVISHLIRACLEGIGDEG